MIRKFHQEKATGPRGFSRWVQPAVPKYLMACCDCDLVHEMQFRVVNGRAQFRARRAERYTAQERKKRKT